MYYNLEKTAETLGLTTGDVNRLREQNKLRAFRDGSNWKFRKEDVENYLTEMIKQRSQAAEQPSQPLDTDLLNDGDEELPTMLADSSSFDSLIDTTADNFAIHSSDATDGLSLVDDNAFELAPETNESPFDDGELRLADDANNAFSPESPSGDELSLASDSGIALLDDAGLLDKSGSDVDLDAGDVVLGGSSGSNLNLAGDSGISLLQDSGDSAFSLGSVDDDQNDGIFELAPEAKETSSVIALDDSADTDTATVLGVEEDFALAPNQENLDESDSESASQVIDLEDEDNLFTTTDEPETTTYGTLDDATPAAAPSEPVAAVAEPIFDAPAASDDNPFGDIVPETVPGGFDAAPGDGFDASGFGAAPENFDSATNGSFGQTTTDASAETLPIAGGCSYAAGKGCAQEPTYSGMAIGLGLVPCLVLLLLSGIGAYELVRTIWSWDQPFGLTGTLLETIGGLFKII